VSRERGCFRQVVAQDNSDLVLREAECVKDSKIPLKVPIEVLVVIQDSLAGELALYVNVIDESQFLIVFSQAGGVLTLFQQPVPIAALQIIL
jgi:hypothetical protein